MFAHWNVLRSFGRDRCGGAAIVFGIALVPAVAIVGSGADYARALQERAKLQTAADSTAMAMARAELDANRFHSRRDVAANSDRRKPEPLHA